MTSVADKSDPKFYAIIDKKTEKATGVVSYEVMISFHTQKKLLTVFYIIKLIIRLEREAIL